MFFLPFNNIEGEDVLKNDSTGSCFCHCLADKKKNDLFAHCIPTLNFYHHKAMLILLGMVKGDTHVISEHTHGMLGVNLSTVP